MPTRIETIFLTVLATLVGLLLIQVATAKPKPVQEKSPNTLILKNVRVTAYCPCEKCCGKYSDGYTADGTEAKGLIIAAPGIIPFGTVLDIPGYGIGVVHDRGGAIKGNRLDVLFPTHQEALEWGVQPLDVEILMD